MKRGVTCQIMKKKKRIIGTTEAAIRRAETLLSRDFPIQFKNWLLEKNGLGIEGVHIYPVLDDRDPRKTWDSIVRNYENGWAAWLENFEDENLEFDHLLPFADFGTGDYYCFDYGDLNEDSEPKIVHWSHETGECNFRAKNFSEFTNKVKSGEFDYD